MKTVFQHKFLQIGFIIMSVSLLTACNTVKGTVNGAGQDIRSVTHAINK